MKSDHRHGPVAAALTIIGVGWSTDRLRLLGYVAISVISVPAMTVSLIGLRYLIDGAVLDRRIDIIIGATIACTSVAVSWISSSTVRSVRFRLREEVTHELTRRIAEAVGGIPTLEHFERPDFANDVELARIYRAKMAGTLDLLINAFSILVQTVLTVYLLMAIEAWFGVVLIGAVAQIVMANRAAVMAERLARIEAEPSRMARLLFELGTKPETAAEMQILDWRRGIVEFYRSTEREIRAIQRKAAVRLSAMQACGSLLYGLFFLGVLSFAIYGALAGRLTVGEVVLAAGLTSRMRQQLNVAQRIIGQASLGFLALSRYLQLTQYATESTANWAPACRRTVPYRLTKGITFKDVWFGYGEGEENDLALRGIDLHLPAGCVMAIVGDNGAGKSTLIKLLARYYKPTAGHIFMDDVDINEYPVEEWRQRISAAFQDYARFELSALESIGVGDLPNRSNSQLVRAAALAAGAEETINGLPNGLDTLLGRSFAGGTDLSGGQWQQMSLARAMMRRDPLMLVLDEPTANIDAPKERALFDRYMANAREAAKRSGSVAIFVSHRFSTIRSADLIVVMDKGSVVEIGSHEYLMGRDGLYSELYRLQAAAYK
jgi:ATP-binding cassette subfamily B protein